MRLILWLLIATFILTAVGVIGLALIEWYVALDILIAEIQFAVLALCGFCATVFKRRSLRSLMWLGTAAFGIAMILWHIRTPTIGRSAFSSTSNHVWYRLFEADLAHIAISFAVIALWFFNLCLLQSFRLSRSSHRWARRIAIFLTTVLALFFICYTVTDRYSLSIGPATWLEVLVERRIFDLLALAVAGTVVTATLALIERLERSNATGRSGNMQIACPRCQQQQLMAIGSSCCNKCGIRIDIDIEEMRCRCGYLLYGKDISVCPECGRRFGAPPTERE